MNLPFVIQEAYKDYKNQHWPQNDWFVVVLGRVVCRRGKYNIIVKGKRFFTSLFSIEFKVRKVDNTIWFFN